jgi:hypothetical protein
MEFRKQNSETTSKIIFEYSRLYLYKSKINIEDAYNCMSAFKYQLMSKHIFFPPYTKLSIKKIVLKRFSQLCIVSFVELKFGPSCKCMLQE